MTESRTRNQALKVMGLFVLVFLISITSMGKSPANAHPPPSGVTFWDGEFNGWVTQAIPNGNPSSGVRIAPPNISPHDEAYFEVTHKIPAHGLQQTLHLNPAAKWNPAVDGPISTIDYSEMARTFATEFNTTGGQTGPLLEQGGDFYVWGFWGTRVAQPTKPYWPAIPGQAPPSPWISLGASGLSEAHFKMVTGPGTINVLMHPDFSITGAPITFGYSRKASHTGSSMSTRVTDIDDWGVTVHPSGPPPEPPTPEPPAFLYDSPLPAPDTCLCMPPFMLVPNQDRHYWWARATGDSDLEIIPIAVGVNDDEHGSVTFSVFDDSDDTPVGVPVMVIHPGQGQDTAGPMITATGASAGDLYRIEVNLNPPPSGPVAHHYSMELKGASLLGADSPLQTTAEAMPTSWNLNVGPSESLDFVVLPALEDATEGDVEIRDPSGTLVIAASIGFPVSIQSAAPGMWRITIPNATGHYIIDKTSGGDRGIYLDWQSDGDGEVSPLITLPDGPFEGLAAINLYEWTPSGPGQLVETVFVSGPNYYAPPLGVGNYIAELMVHPGFTVIGSNRLDFTVTCNATVELPFELIPPTTTRTQGFWSTHFDVAKDTWLAIPPPYNDRKVLGTRDMTNHPGVLKEVMGGFWSNIAKKSTGKGKIAQRSSLDQARMTLVQQYLAAVLNVQAFGTPDGGIVAAGKAAFEGTDRNAMIEATAALAAFNEGGDEDLLPDWFDQRSADPKKAKRAADLAFWNVLD